MTATATVAPPAPRLAHPASAVLRRYARPAPVTASAALAQGPVAHQERALSVSELDTVLGVLDGHHRVLVRSGSWVHEHAATYLDSADLTAFRTGRFEVRLREEMATHASFVEVTQATRSGRATASRNRSGSGDVLSPAEWAFAASELRSKSGVELPEWLLPTLSSRHRSVVLVGRDQSWRLAIDFDVVLTDGRRATRLRPDLVIATLTSSGSTVADSAWSRLEPRPATSAYCAGLSLLRSGTPQPYSLFDLAG